MASVQRLALLWCALASALSLIACGPTEPAKNPRFDLSKRRQQQAPAAPASLEGPPGLPAVIIAELASEATEVHFARNGNRGLLLSRKDGRWLTGPLVLDQDEAVPSAQPELADVAPAPADPGPLALVPRGEGFLLVWARPSQAGDEVWAQALGSDGQAEGEARRVPASYPEVRWVDALVADEGPTTLIWEVRRGETSDVHVASWSLSSVGDAKRVAEDVLGWHAAGGRRGAGIAWVSGRDNQGTAHFVAMGADGALAKPITLSPRSATGPTAEALPDVQVARVGDGYLVAWTDESQTDPHVWLARLTGGGALAADPGPAVAPVGGQALLAIVGAEDHGHALLAWERAPVTGDRRRVELTILDGSGAPGARAALELHGGASAPHVVPDGRGFAALTLAPMRHASARPDPAGDPLGPVFVRFDERLGVRSAEPIRVAALTGQSVGAAGVPAQVHGLSCAGGLCSLLATGSGEPALLALVSLPLREALWRAPAERLGPTEPPEATALEGLAMIDAPLADVDAVRLHDGRTLVAWVTHYAGKSDDGSVGPAPPGATLAYRFVEANGKLGKVHVLSERAISIGGVDVAPLPASEKGVAVLGWAGPSNGASQVYLTVLDERGDKLRQKTLTKVNRPQKSELPNEVYDVAIAVRDDGGVVCTWADTRDGNPEIYVARANRHLERRDRERRVTENETMSVEPTVAIADGRVLVAWTDGPSDDSDLFLRALDPDKLVPLGPPNRVHDGAGRTKRPAWAGAESGALSLSWLDESADGSATTLHMVALDDGGKAITAVRDIALPGSKAITSSTIRCNAERCRGVVSALDGALLRLGAFDTQRKLGGPVRGKPLLTLPGGTAQDVGLASSSTDVDVAYFARDRPEGTLLRRLRLRW